ncbi:metalloprotease [Phellopilus nigrolimitatus]|nr:metalloprotease [Phellopilus nigrolimitatus]
MFKSILFAFVLVSTAFASSSDRCGTERSDEEIALAEKKFQTKLSQSKLGNVDSAPGARSAADTTISVYWHVISEDDTTDGGNIPDSQISDSIDVLNQDYVNSGLTFELVSTDRNVNADWFDHAGPDTDQQTAMKEQLRQGSAADLNVYSTGFVDIEKQGLLGYATFPDSFQENQEDDGVVIAFTTVPGGSQTGFNSGKTLTHEVGHWLGLYHTFQGGCYNSGDAGNSGDFVSDTPAEASPASGCPTGRDTCSSSGVDPIHNYMDYSDDACLTEFTQGQYARITNQVGAFRDIIV